MRHLRRPPSRTLPPVAVAVIMMFVVTAASGGGSASSGHVRVEVERGDDKVYHVEAAFDVDVHPDIVWGVLTDYDDMSSFVSSIRRSVVKSREPGRAIVEQEGVGRAWILSVPMHVVLDVREDKGRALVFRDLSARSFTTYEGRWDIAGTDGRTRVRYRLKAEPSGLRPAFLARPALRGSVEKLLDEVRDEILARAAAVPS